MSLPRMPDDPSKSDLIEIVGWFMAGSGDEIAGNHVFEYLDRHLPDPEWSSIIFWPSHHAETRAMGIDESTRPGLTPEQVVEIVFRYRPIAL